MRSPNRGFWALIVTQFQGAFSDNALKGLVTFVGLAAATTAAQRNSLVPLLGILFSVPFILFSMTGGQLADRYSKRTVTIGVKIFEIAVMLFALASFLAGNLWMGMTGVFLMGVHSAIFGPSKYGLLPELLPAEDLSWGNGIIEMGTFLAIITGTAVAGVLYAAFEGRTYLAAVALLALACVGLVTSLGITRVPAAAPDKPLKLNVLGDFAAQMRLIGKSRVLSLAVLGNVWFTFIGFLIQQNTLLFATDTLHAKETGAGLLLAGLGVGIGIGSVAAGILSGGKIEYGLVPLGTIGMTVFGAALVWSRTGYVSSLVLLGIVGFFGGFFYVPVAAIMQYLPAKGEKGGVLAAANLLSFVGVLAAAGAYWVLTVPLGLSTRQVFLACALATLGGTVYVVWLLPDALLRLVLWMLTHTVYRIRVLGRENIPQRGGALFVVNHMSFVDGLLVIASTDRFIRFLAFKDIYELPYFKPIARLIRVIPISSGQRPREMVKSLRDASDAIRAGEIVAIFPEGQITRTGMLLPFRRGFERIMKDVEAPIVPVHLDGVWGSIFSFEKGRFLWKLPRRIPYPVTVSFGAPLPPDAHPHEVRRAVQELGSAAWAARKGRMTTLHRGFVRAARRHPFRFAMADPRVARRRNGGALIMTIVLARRLAARWRGQSMVGLLLPPSVPAALANFAALLSGKVPVNLNYTVSAETLASCARQCGITTILTSREFLEKVPMTLPCEAIYLDDLAAAKPGLGERLAALAMAFALPAPLLERALADRSPVTTTVPPGTPLPRPGRAGLDDLATVIFSSGSTGEPKGVMLTHGNIAANVEQLAQTFAFDKNDRVLGILPFFHSFGFTGCVVLPALTSLGVVFYPSPLDARAIGPLVRRYRVTFLIATPTFLNLYVRGVSPEDFGSLRLVLAGAEKLPERVSAAFEDRFGIRPMEGYGSTECAPAITVNTPDFRAAGFRQVGAKRGKIGHPLPGVSVRIVDPDMGAPVAAGESGLLLVRGPNVMAGYLGKPDKTAEVIRDGWYVTGDIAAEDEDGFLTITDRLSRFSKIGGEMVPHIRIEEALHDLAGVTEQAFAVAGIPDERKGERLVVLHTLKEDALSAVLEKLPQAGLPNLWIPRPDAFFKVDALPYLGTGKLDLRKVRETALARATG
jgi:acyl-[acyl-carrier-protein]-phospholipid O-acyltransferase/long-chain-fatty-acid--[acyl-carrier-protein] ligase